jgi:hypothetical protein
MEVFGYAITFLSIVLAIISWRNGRDMKAAVSAIQADIQASREQTARQHEDVVALLRAMDERTERFLLRIAELIAAEDERTRAALRDGGHGPSG